MGTTKLPSWCYGENKLCSTWDWKASQENSKMHVQEPNDISQSSIQEES